MAGTWIILLIFGGWRMAGIMWGEDHDDPIYLACTDTYGDKNCQCFAGILSVQLSQRAYQSYVRDLERDAYRRRGHCPSLTNSTELYP